MRKLIIDRTKWLRGEGSADSYLKRERDGKMCCLGFYLEACGVPADKLVSRRDPISSFLKEGENLRSAPSGISERFPEDMKWLVETYDSIHSQDAIELIQRNDTGSGAFRELYADPISSIPLETQRENEIKRFFAKHDVEVIFEG